jgi:nitrate reductase NapAB chaperone NapD
MPISGLVVTLSPQSGEHESVVQQIRNHRHLQAGPRQDLRLPVVVDTPDREADKACWQWLNSLPGVHQVDVAFIHFEDDDPEAASCFNTAQDNSLIASPTIGET